MWLTNFWTGRRSSPWTCLRPTLPTRSLSVKATQYLRLRTLCSHQTPIRRPSAQHVSSRCVVLLGLLASARGTRAGCLAGSLTNSIMRQFSDLDTWHVAKAAKLPELPSRCSGKFRITAGASLGDTFTSVSEHASTHFRQCSQEPELCNSRARADDTAGIKSLKAGHVRRRTQPNNRACGPLVGSTR